MNPDVDNIASLEQHKENCFDRMTMVEGGHFPNTLRLFPIERIAISDSGIEFLVRQENKFYLWDEIIAAEIESQESHIKDMVRELRGNMLREPLFTVE